MLNGEPWTGIAERTHLCENAMRAGLLAYNTRKAKENRVSENHLESTIAFSKIENGYTKYKCFVPKAQTNGLLPYD